MKLNSYFSIAINRSSNSIINNDSYTKAGCKIVCLQEKTAKECFYTFFKAQLSPVCASFPPPPLLFGLGKQARL